MKKNIKKETHNSCTCSAIQKCPAHRQTRHNDTNNKHGSDKTEHNTTSKKSSGEKTSKKYRMHEIDQPSIPSPIDRRHRK